MQIARDSAHNPPPRVNPLPHVIPNHSPYMPEWQVRIVCPQRKDHGFPAKRASESGILAVGCTALRRAWSAQLPRGYSMRSRAYSKVRSFGSDQSAFEPLEAAHLGTFTINV